MDNYRWNDWNDYAGSSQFSGEIRTEERINNDADISNVIYNLSEADDFNANNESDSEDTDDSETNNDGGDDSDSTSDEDNEIDQTHNTETADLEGHIVTAPWFTTEEISNNDVTDNEAAMKNIKELNPDAERWLRDIPLKMWTMSHDGGCRYGQATTNMVESFNGSLRSARFLPITSMVEYIYYRSVKLVAERRTQTLNDLQNGHIYCKKSRELFENIEQKASAHKIIPYNEQMGVFEVITARYKTKKYNWKGGNKHNIDLQKGFCSCGKWYRYHSPCSHIVAGCLACHLDWKQYIEPYHNLATLYEIWQYEFHPLSNQAYWTFPLANDWEKYGTLVPDEELRKFKKKCGKRGQSHRIRTEMDNSQRAMKCGRCGQEDHTKRSVRCPLKGHHEQ